MKLLCTVFIIAMENSDTALHKEIELEEIYREQAIQVGHSVSGV